MPLVGILAVPLVGLLGLAIDLSRLVMVSEVATSAARSAAGVAAVYADAPAAQVIARGTAAFKAGFPDGFLGATVGPVVFTELPASPPNNQGLPIRAGLTAAVTVPTIVMGAFGRGSVVVTVAAMADRTTCSPATYPSPPGNPAPDPKSCGWISRTP